MIAMARSLVFALAILIFNYQTTAYAAGPAVLFEAGSGKILYAEDANRLWYPASLTKMLTAYIAFEEIRDGKISLKEHLICSPRANRQPPSKIGLPVGGQMTVKLGLEALIVKSANDVAVMIAEKVSGSVEEFAKRMNKTAKRLGMTKSRFFNPHGLPDGRQVTTARDMALLAQAIIRDFPQHAGLFTQTHVRIGKRKLRSHNDLLRTYKGTDGMKTGFVCASGFNVVASATRNNRRLVAVVLGAKSSANRRVRAKKLFNHGFENYEWKALFESKNLSELALEDPRGPRNMRRRLRSWSCGNRPRRVAKRKTKKVKKSTKKPKSKTVKRASVKAKPKQKKAPVKRQ